MVEGTAHIKEELEETKNWLANIIMDQFLRFSRKQEEIHDWLADMIMQKVDIGVVCTVGEVTEEFSKVAITEKGEPMEEESVTDIMEVEVDVDVDVNNTHREKDVIATKRLVESLRKLKEYLEFSYSRTEEVLKMKTGLPVPGLEGEENDITDPEIDIYEHEMYGLEHGQDQFLE